MGASPAEAAPFANTTSNNVPVIDTATNTGMATIPVGTNPVWLAVAPNGKHVYVTNINSANVSVIRTATNTVVATIPVGTFPIGVAVTPDGTHAYVANNGSNNISVIATATKTVVATVPVGTNPVGGHPRRGTRLRREILCQQCFGDRHGHQHGGGQDPGGNWPRGGSRWAMMRQSTSVTASTF